MEKQLPIRCLYAAGEDVRKILQQAFALYLTCVLTEQDRFAG